MSCLCHNIDIIHQSGLDKQSQHKMYLNTLTDLHDTMQPLRSEKQHSLSCQILVVSMLSLTCLYPSMTLRNWSVRRNKYYTLGPLQMRIKLCTRQLSICSVQVIHLNKSLKKYFLYIKTPLLFWTDQVMTQISSMEKNYLLPNSVIIWRLEQTANHWLSLPWFTELSDHVRSV